VNSNLVFRLFLDAVQAVLFVAALAYWWQGNTTHEVIGTILIALLIAHVIFHRRWFGALGRGRYDLARRLATGGNLLVLVAMVTLLVTSLLLSRTVFAFLPLEGGMTAREAHILAAYWLVVIVGMHVGLNWWRVMPAMARLLGVTEVSPIRRIVLRVAAALVSAYGVLAIGEMALGSKLINQVTLDMWDFSTDLGRFFFNYAAILGLVATLTHYLLTWAKRRKAHRQVGAGQVEG
jgi:hypothetical protein